MATHADAHHDAHAHHTPTGWRRYMFSTNHKDIGTLYLIFAIAAGIIGGAMSIAMRMELAGTGVHVFPWISKLMRAMVRSTRPSTCTTCSSRATASS